MKILVIGAGIVGEATGDGFKRMGNDVVFHDIDENKKKALLKKGFSVFDKDRDSYEDFDIFFVCVEEWNINKVFEEWQDAFNYGIVVIRSTIPPGTCQKLTKKYDFNVFHNPEFLRERNALNDFLYPDKIIIGCDSKCPMSLWNIYQPFDAPVVVVDTVTSEFLKLASNAVLSTYISTWNQLSLIADKLKINSHQVAKILTLDPRISKYGTIHGHRYAGFCLPKDMKTLIKTGKDLNVNIVLLDAVEKINEEMRE